MKIFYINIEEFIKKYGKNYIENFADKTEYKSEKRLVEYGIGRFLVKAVGEKFYNIKNTDIIIENSKPKFKDNDLQFNITHSNEYVMAIFDDKPCAIDLEFIRNININAMSKRYKKNFVNNIEFYKFWTLKETEIKLQSQAKYNYTGIFMDKYMFAISSISPFSNDIKFTNLLEILK